eukprot:CAMPEP_0172451570 /NCGR_PEP_ID=MMETSP1065-20121228/9564_1 /TAXON_ID=265537 /ORGANISM="Amphiprora paludosa, Strain CCMP125" /LENGTH=1663 /DNA_ID=CAMNT_0013203533 /DNA_START=72 /DNA_END=5063 /DNA_ORIENTATION=+
MSPKQLHQAPTNHVGGGHHHRSLSGGSALSAASSSLLVQKILFSQQPPPEAHGTPDHSMLDDSASAVSDNFATMSQAETELHDNRTLEEGGTETPLRGRPNLRFLPPTTTATPEPVYPSSSRLAPSLRPALRPHRTSLTPVGTSSSHSTRVMAAAGFLPSYGGVAAATGGDCAEIRRTKSMDSAARGPSPTKTTTTTTALPPLFASTKPKNNNPSTAAQSPSNNNNNSQVQSPPLLARRPMSLGADGTTQRRAVSATLSTTAFADNEELPSSNNNYHQESFESEPVVWEEEATPAQTAFGKELMFARTSREDQLKQQQQRQQQGFKSHDLDTSSEGVLSTASEMGTVINNAARMAELDAELTQEQEEFLNHGGDGEQPQRHEYDDDDDDDNRLNLPPVSVLPENNGSDNANAGDEDDDDDNEHGDELTHLRPRPFVGNDSSVSGILPPSPLMEQPSEQEPYSHDDVVPSLLMPRTGGTSGGPVTSSPSGLSPSRLSMAIRKTIMNAGHNNTRRTSTPYDNENRDNDPDEIETTLTETNGMKDEAATQTPPRGMLRRTSVVPIIPQSHSWSEGEGIEVTLSPSRGNSQSHMGDDSFRTDTARVDQTPRGDTSSPDATPSSFLLRSPGSSAFLAAASSQKKKSRKSLWQQRKQRHSDVATTSPQVERSTPELLFSSSASSISASSSSAVGAIANAKQAAQRHANWSSQKVYHVPIVNEDEVLQDPDIFGSHSGENDSKINNVGGGGTADAPPEELLSPMRIERAYFSFDNDHRAVQRPSSFGTSAASSGESGPPQFQLNNSSNTNLNNVSRASQAGSTHVMLGSGNVSLSWDVASSSAAANTPFKSPSATARQRLRQQQQQHNNNTDLTSNFASAFAVGGPRHNSKKALGPATIPEYASHNPDDNMGDLPPHQQQQQHQGEEPPPPNDFSPLIPNHNMAEELKTPQRIEIEREDAIDILACLVERGVSLHQVGNNPSSATSSQTTVSARNSAFSPETPQESFPASDALSLQDMTNMVEGLKELARMEEDTAKRRMKLGAIDELIKSHVYALEMSRAAKSACSWLKSIGREDIIDSKELTAEPDDDGSEKKEDDGGRTPQFSSKRAATATPRNSIELLTTKARLHAAEDQLAARAIEMEQLNEELAQCRAEIGRIRSTGQAAPFRSPNRSILDEDGSATEGDDEDGADPGAEQDANSDPPIPGTAFSLDREGEVILYKKALEEANAMITKLHGALKSDHVEDVPENPPCIFVQEPNRPKVEKNLSPSNKEEATINVHMLDGENFITDWDDAPPLPPPPDHNLRSPMVQSVLETWTQDEGLHESMLAWMDQVLTGVDPESIPPLTISSLDHQVKDGFSLHVLPLLLKRKDILVEIKTRVQRRTTYDLAVSVDRPSITGLDMRRHLETIAARSDVGATSDAVSISHSATTALMGNGRRAFVMNASAASGGDTGAMSPGTAGMENHAINQQHLMYDEMAEDMEDPNGANSTGLMSALGGALGGFLTRNRKAAVAQGDVGGGDHQDSTAQHQGTATGQTYQQYDISSMSPSNKPANAAAAAELDEEQPYHRVVSAPSGRIGVTFVEFRGHAMVSDVAPESPLQGWIFPSDILIAIDELPVSGMRVRDIIQVLKDRMDRQRALRIISCHAMNEITDFSNGSTSPLFGEAET